jgi:hypothetical protein
MARGFELVGLAVGKEGRIGRTAGHAGPLVPHLRGRVRDPRRPLALVLTREMVETQTGLYLIRLFAFLLIVGDRG